MNNRYIKLGVGFLVACVLSSQAPAIMLNDPGVVGTVDAGTQNVGFSQGNELAWAQYLLDMAASATATYDADGNGTTEYYMTSSTDYSGILTVAAKDDTGSNVVPGGYEYVMGKYDGQNAGFILYNMADWFADTGSYDISQDSNSIWTNPGNQGYGLSHWIAFNGGSTSVPEPSTLLLLGVGLVGIGFTRRKKHEAMKVA